LTWIGAFLAVRIREASLLKTGAMIPSLKRECQLRGRLLFDMGAPLGARG